MPTLGISPDSVGNAPVTCRSVENRVEGQLPDQVISNYRPEVEVAVSRLSTAEQTFIHVRLKSAAVRLSRLTLRRPCLFDEQEVSVARMHRPQDLVLSILLG